MLPHFSPTWLWSPNDGGTKVTKRATKAFVVTEDNIVGCGRGGRDVIDLSGFFTPSWRHALVCRCRKLDAGFRCGSRSVLNKVTDFAEYKSSFIWQH